MFQSPFLDGIAFIAAAFLLPLVALVLIIASFRRRHQKGWHRVWIWTTLLILLLISNPFSQPFLLEGVDNLRGAALARRAYGAGIIGMDQEQVRKLLGEPTRIREYSDTPTWEYKQIPGYWLGSYFQVFFKAGKVYGIEQNDD